MYTDQQSYPSTQLSPITIPAKVRCKRLIMRQLPTDAQGVAFSVAAPTAANGLAPHNPYEQVVFEALDYDGQRPYFEPTDVNGNPTTLGYIQPASGTITFSRKFE